MTYHREAPLEASARDEQQVRDALTERGWTVVYVGQRAWPAAVCEVMHRDTRWPLRVMPDLLATHPQRGVRLVEVIRSGGRDFAHVPVQLAKLAGLDPWTAIAPVAVVDVADMSAWRHYPYAWTRDVIAPLQRMADGSGTPFALMRRRGHVPFAGGLLP
jgi:hypothetical protein